jgi:hypothetical protein
MRNPLPPLRIYPGDAIEVLGRRFIVARYDKKRHSFFTECGHEVSAYLADDGDVQVIK